MKEIIINGTVDNQVIFGQIKSALDNKKIIAFPTDTVYGIGCDPDSMEAINNIYVLKNRPASMPLILLGSSIEQLEPYVNKFTLSARNLADKFWPGSLTMVMEKSSRVNKALTNMDTIGIRVPAHKFLLEFLNFYGKPLATTSANISGTPSANDAQSIKENLDTPLLELVIDTGESYHKTASSIADLSVNPPQILREGVIKADSILRILAQEL